MPDVHTRPGLTVMPVLASPSYPSWHHRHARHGLLLAGMFPGPWRLGLGHRLDSLDEAKLTGSMRPN